MTAAIWNSPERLLALDTAARSQDLSRVVVTDGAGVRYFTGFTGSSGYLLHTPAGVPTLITDFRYEEQAAAEAASGINVHVANEGWVSGLADILGAARGERIGFDPEHLMVSDLERLEERLPDVEFVSVRGLGTRLRARKDDKEIAAIERAARIAEAALEDVLVSVDWHDGPTELDVAVALEMALRVAGSTGLPFDVIVASGERTSRPHATPSTGRVEAGDLVLLDFGAIASGYCSDITRTFVVGPPHPWQKDIHA
ncbi:MAG: M24 family metallopeptidase, partial [Gemmatimonadota bacterium]|nr:M24 family metallopeptidase [Gemmatimonadota bacterium]